MTDVHVVQKLAKLFGCEHSFIEPTTEFADGMEVYSAARHE